MPLPVAQLGYIPNINVPQSSTKFKPQNPWEQLAMQIVGQAVGKGVGNLMTPEMVDQATQAGVENAGEAQPWWKKAVTGPTMSPEQYQQALTRKQQMDLFTKGQNNEFAREQNRFDYQNAMEQLREDAASGRHNAQISAQENLHKSDIEARAAEGRANREAEFSARSNQLALEAAKMAASMGQHKEALTEAQFGHIASMMPKIQDSLNAAEVMYRADVDNAKKTGQPEPTLPDSLLKLRNLSGQMGQFVQSKLSGVFGSTGPAVPQMDTMPKAARTPVVQPPPKTVPAPVAVPTERSPYSYLPFTGAALGPLVGGLAGSSLVTQPETAENKTQVSVNVPQTGPVDPSILISRALSQSAQQNAPGITDALKQAELFKYAQYILSGGRPQ